MGNSTRSARLDEGLYESLITSDMDAKLRDLAEGTLSVDAVELAGADAAAILARHLGSELERVLRAFPNEERLLMQVGLTNQVLEFLKTQRPDEAPDLVERHVAPPARQLRAIYRGAPPERPETPLASSTLLTRNRAEPAIGHELAREIASSDRVDALVAFITMGGVRVLRDALEAFARRGGRLRVLTTTFTETTEQAAVDYLARLPGAEVRVSYDVRRTRLHAKAWLFGRNTGLDTAYVGSANLTKTALGSGHEWMVKACAADLPHVLEKFAGTFESLWNEAEFEPYDPREEAHVTRLATALKGSESPTLGGQVFFELRPFPYQEEILDRLAAERSLQGRNRNLVVAATGTGKTVVAAFDYKRQVDRIGVTPRLLFLAHRRELLEQARATFRHVLRDGAFGELLAQGETPSRYEHLFSTIQSATSSGLLARFGDDYFRYVVVDECHHLPADSYQSVVPRLRPEILLGLTATPERTDGRSLLPDFDGTVAAELRLWHALERQLLVPFEYYGVSDGTDLSRVKWTRSGYDMAQLSELYTSNDFRMDLVVRQLKDRVSDPQRIRALAFCVSTEHAEFVARALTNRGVPALAVHGQTNQDVRADAGRRLREREVNVLCTCDLYNEGVDFPFVDALLMLRPTESATLFLQQLGRGLRLHSSKTTCLVLDFIGQHRTEYRFDKVLSALSGVPRAGLARAVERGFPYLPSGCALQLDSVARERILSSLRSNLATARRLADEVKELSAHQGESLTLRRYLDQSGRALEDVYGVGEGWSTLRRAAGLLQPDNDVVDDLSRRLGWLLHTDEPARLQVWERFLADTVEGGGAKPLSVADSQRVLMLEHQLNNRGVLRSQPETLAALTKHPEIRDEFRQLSEVLRERISLANDDYPIPEWPLALHRHYARREILAAVGFVKPGGKVSYLQAGVLKVAEKREILLVTLDKSASTFSPTTRYRDYAISRDRFHWETQSIVSVSKASGARYIHSPGNGWEFFLFVRPNNEVKSYTFLGPVRYLSHTGDRPIAITWQLERAMPAGHFQRFATLAQG